MIEIDHLTFDYADGTRALDDVSLAFPPEHVMAVVGESGSGKTTLLNCIARFLPAPPGTIRLDDTDIHAIGEREFRRRIGVVFQRLYLFPHLTALENMTLAPVKTLGVSPAEARADAMGMLDRLGIADLADSYPAQISGGQAQRVAIARGLMLRPEYMLLDEPTSALDAKTTGEFAAWLRELREETHFIIVTHDLLFARDVATHGVVLADGRVLATGVVERILQQVGGTGLEQ